jgi:phosphonate transport system permease protein
MVNLQQQWLNRKLIQASIFGVFLILFGLSLYSSEFNLQNLNGAGERFIEFFTRLVPPDWSVKELVFKATVETLSISFAGTFLAVLISLPLGFIAASNISPPWIAHPLKLTLGLIRSVPIIIMALLFVASMGLGPFPGVLAIAVHSIGMLAKFYAEEFETADKGIIDAVKGTGASWVQTVHFGVFKQCIPQVLAFTIYRFEMNFRDATVLGFVGAGGIGTYIMIYTQSYQYERVAVLLIMISVVIFAMDQASFWLRRKVQ